MLNAHISRFQGSRSKASGRSHHAETFFRGHATCASILGLTKVDWNNNTLYKTLPVTMVYSQVFAEVVKQTPDIVNETYDYRFFM
jgi:hypothetical protein